MTFAEILTIVLAVLALIGIGGAAVFWPMSLKNKLIVQENKLLKKELMQALVDVNEMEAAGKEILDVERIIDNARDLDSSDELRLLLSGERGPEELEARRTGARLGVVEPDDAQGSEVDREESEKVDRL